jgi:hypothetical protein
MYSCRLLVWAKVLYIESLFYVSVLISYMLTHYFLPSHFFPDVTFPLVPYIFLFTQSPKPLYEVGTNITPVYRGGDRGTER